MLAHGKLEGYTLKHTSLLITVSWVGRLSIAVWARFPAFCWVEPDVPVVGESDLNGEVFEVPSKLVLVTPVFKPLPKRLLLPVWRSPRKGLLESALEGAVVPANAGSISMGWTGAKSRFAAGRLESPKRLLLKSDIFSFVQASCFGGLEFSNLWSCARGFGLLDASLFVKELLDRSFDNGVREGYTFCEEVAELQQSVVDYGKGYNVLWEKEKSNEVMLYLQEKRARAWFLACAFQPCFVLASDVTSSHNHSFHSIHFLLFVMIKSESVVYGRDMWLVSKIWLSLFHMPAFTTFHDVVLSYCCFWYRNAIYVELWPHISSKLHALYT